MRHFFPDPTPVPVLPPPLDATLCGGVWVMLPPARVVAA